MESSYLAPIIESHRARAARDQRDWRVRRRSRRRGSSFAEALGGAASPYVAVIAEVKRRSPSRGWLDEHLDAASLARAYADAGAVAVSVLTDEEFFAGRLDDLREVRSSVDLPVLRKDFTVCENDVLDAAEAGAAAVLLIVAALSDDELARYVALADECDLDALVEVHDADEITRAIDAGAQIIGINQRNLHTFAVDPDHAQSLVAQIPRSCLAVCESGLSNVDDVGRAARAGFDAVLVGEAFVSATDRDATVRAFTHATRHRRG